MTRLFSVCFLSVGTMISATMAYAQSAADAASLPAVRGVYFRAGTAWASLPWTPLMPYNKGEIQEFLSVGRAYGEAAIPGPHALTQISGPPVFYVRGLTSAMGPRLVRVGTKHDYRQIKMRRGGIFEPRSPFYDADTRDIEITQVAPDVVAIRPKGTLSSGEYAVVTTASKDQRRMFLGFDFRIQ